MGQSLWCIDRSNRILCTLNWTVGAVATQANMNIVPKEVKGRYKYKVVRLLPVGNILLGAVSLHGDFHLIMYVVLNSQIVQV